MGLGANFLVVYDKRYHRPIFARAIKTPNAKKQKVWAFRMRIIKNIILTIINDYKPLLMAINIS